MMNSIRTLLSLYKLGGAFKDFVLAFVGQAAPRLLPHEGQWSCAENHWEIVVELCCTVKEIVGSGEIPYAESLNKAEKAARLMLWALAKNHKCPLCDSVDLMLHPGRELYHEYQE
jgi:hypothetical protein